MPRSVISAIAFVSILVAAHPVFADPVQATASDRAQAAVTVTEQPTSTANAPSSPDVWVPVDVKSSKAPVGFGWG